MSQYVLERTLPCENGRLIGHLTLDRPKSLNALNLDMIRALSAALLRWQDDENIVAVVIDSKSEKAFCAGGDVVSLYHALQDNPEQAPTQVQDFFIEEYRLDYLIHRYAKPTVVIAHGVVMGGGVGIFAGADVRAVTETTKMAMPETSIGLYPDVGASWFLNKMPRGVGLLLGLSGMTINARDALDTYLANAALSEEKIPAFLTALQQLSWTGNRAKDIDLIRSSLNPHALLISQLPASELAKLSELCAELAAAGSPERAISLIAQTPTEQDSWLAKAQYKMSKGCPLTSAIVFEQLRRGAQLTLLECFKMELIISCRCAELGDFQEGVRALLVDKDKKPQWRFANVAEIPEATLDYCFTSPWEEQTHPLADLS